MRRLDLEPIPRARLGETEVLGVDGSFETEMDELFEQ